MGPLWTSHWKSDDFTRLRSLRQSTVRRSQSLHKPFYTPYRKGCRRRVFSMNNSSSLLFDRYCQGSYCPKMCWTVMGEARGKMDPSCQWHGTVCLYNLLTLSIADIWSEHFGVLSTFSTFSLKISLKMINIWFSLLIISLQSILFSTRTDFDSKSGHDG